MTHTAYLGPSGSFTEAALAGLGTPRDRAVPYASVQQALAAARTGAADAAVVPWENSVEGPVTATVDALARHPGLSITGETLLRVEFVLAAPSGHASAPVRRVLTHPHAHAQCRDWLEERLPHAEFVPTGSTAEAARTVAEAGVPGDAAIAAPATAAGYGLDLLAEGIGDRPDAVTRFVRVVRVSLEGRDGRDDPLPAPTGEDRSTLFVPLAGPVGELQDVLREFTRTRTPLTAVLPRPAGDGLGRYSFLLECEGHIDQPAVRTTVDALRRRFTKTRFLGSYPRAVTRPLLTPTTPTPTLPR
ncbi:prephenate dehydratase [Streptacidiphilus sp. MAP5-3]|uniref:prephenate dehydratase n=1 Tax=unclassified Streptacidiphilus TaxID=2643834 RepID=UPI003515204F